MQNNKVEQNVVKQFLRSEITWTASIILAVMGFVGTVVLPIQALQLGQLKIQEQLTSESTKYTINENRITQLEKNQAVVMSILSIKQEKN